MRGSAIIFANQPQPARARGRIPVLAVVFNYTCTATPDDGGALVTVASSGTPAGSQVRLKV